MAERSGISKQRTYKVADFCISAALLLVGVVSRLPFRSEFLFENDSFLFARGAERYDLRAGFPHPPGYIFYVYLGRWLNFLVKDINASFIWLGIVFVALTAVCLYFLGKEIWNRWVGTAAGILYLSSPLVWFYSEIALTYVAEGFWVVLAALFCWRSVKGNRAATYCAAISLGLAGGFRLWITMFALPLFVYSSYKQGLKTFIFSLLLLAATSLTWLIPNFILTGGAGNYFGIVSNYNRGLYTEAQGLLNWAGQLHRLDLMASWLWLTLGFG